MQHVSWHLQADNPIFEHQVTLQDNYQLVAVLVELGSMSDSPSPRSLAVAGVRGGCKAAPCRSSQRILCSPSRKNGKEGEIFANDQMSCEFNRCGPGLTSERYLVLMDFVGFDPEGTAQVSRPIALPVVRDFKSEINRGEVEGLARAV